MTRWIHTNLDAEYAWAHHPQPYTPNRHALAMRARWAHLLRLAPGCLEAEVWERGPRPSSLTTWGADEGDALALARNVNDKRLSHALSEKLGVGLPGAGIVENLEDLEALISSTPSDRVLKHPLGVSGRERALGRALRLEANARGWARRQLARGWTLVWEPWAKITREWSVHADLDATGVVWRGGTQIQTDGTGTPRGHIIDPAQAIEPHESQRDALDALWEAGYRGPASVDAWESEEASRPISEINARWTFGRMAWELGRWMPAGWAWAWWHPPRSAPVDAGAWEALGEHATGWFRLPERIDPRGASGTLVACAPDLASLPQRPPTTDSSSR